MLILEICGISAQFLIPNNLGTKMFTDLIMFPFVACSVANPVIVDIVFIEQNLRLKSNFTIK